MIKLLRLAAKLLPLICLASHAQLRTHATLSLPNKDLFPAMSLPLHNDYLKLSELENVS